MAQQRCMAEAETKVLVCVDPSETSERAFRWYLKTFYNPGHKIVLCHVPEYWGDVGRMMSPAKIKEVVEQTNADTVKLGHKCEAICKEAGIDGPFEVLRGCDVWHEICEYAKKIDANAIVIGTRGMGVIKRTLLGSVSDGVLHHCHVPVLIYKE